MNTDKAKDAIRMALESRWREAVTVNSGIVREHPNDFEAYNRLGKALSELGNYKKAIKAFMSAVKISPENIIAKRNLIRLEQLSNGVKVRKTASKIVPHFFLGERGKSIITSLRRVPLGKAHLHTSPGSAVEFKAKKEILAVVTTDGQYLGELESNLGLRLAKLIKGGNKYTVAITSVKEDKITVMIKESYKHRDQGHIVSFPIGRDKLMQRSNSGNSNPPSDIDYDDEIIELDRPPIIEWNEEGEANIVDHDSSGDQSIASLGDSVQNR